MSQVSIDGSNLHRLQFRSALDVAVLNGDLSEYKAAELWRSYNESDRGKDGC